MHTIKFVILLFAIAVFFPHSILADWGSREPSSIDSFANPGEVNAHYNSGGRRIVRILNKTIVICPHGVGERMYRSSDNGLTWQEIDDDGAFSGSLITGPNKIVYHFYRSGNSIYMVRFKYDESPPPPQIIYSDPNLSQSSHGVYQMVNATIDKDGVLYLASHWRDRHSDSGDSLYLIRSLDGGSTWTAPGEAIVIRQGSASYSLGFAHMDVTKTNTLVMVYTELKSKFIQFARSIDRGNSWSTVEIASGKIYNPAVLPVGENKIFIFAQSYSSSNLRGLVMNLSTDEGKNWAGWRVIDDASLSGYADPSPGLGVEGQLFVAYRSGARTDLVSMYGGKACRERIAMSLDGGNSWTFPDNFFYITDGVPTPRTGTRSQIRYQTWFNYGGPLEWIWMQYDESGLNRTIYYDINLNESIRNETSFDEEEGGGDTDTNSKYQAIYPSIMLLEVE